MQSALQGAGMRVRKFPGRMVALSGRNVQPETVGDWAAYSSLGTVLAAGVWKAMKPAMRWSSQGKRWC